MHHVTYFYKEDFKNRRVNTKDELELEKYVDLLGKMHPRPRLCILSKSIDIEVFLKRFRFQKKSWDLVTILSAFKIYFDNHHRVM